MATIFRFTSFEQLVDIMQRKALAFVLPFLWDDPFEGYIVKILKDGDGLQRVRDVLDMLEYQPGTKVLLLSLFGVASKLYHGQSWTQLSESDALWRIYSHNNFAIRLEIKESNIALLDGVKAYMVNYVDSLDLTEEIKSIPVEGHPVNITTHTHKIFTTKRSAFSHEKEVRLLADNKESILNKENMLPVLRGIIDDNGGVIVTNNQWLNYYKAVSGDILDKIPAVKYISFNHIPNFVESVMLHPLAPTWFDDTLATFCEKNCINYLGRSKLYQFY